MILALLILAAVTLAVGLSLAAWVWGYTGAGPRMSGIEEEEYILVLATGVLGEALPTAREVQAVVVDARKAALAAANLGYYRGSVARAVASLEKALDRLERKGFGSRPPPPPGGAGNWKPPRHIIGLSATGAERALEVRRREEARR